METILSLSSRVVGMNVYLKKSIKGVYYVEFDGLVSKPIPKYQDALTLFNLMVSEEVRILKEAA